ncbi:hypothetical protein D6D29_08773 [Aureobasidium pullulans]|nr:hypothetical protein D6D29_08773 [Aureobasidium pullulans]
MIPSPLGGVQHGTPSTRPWLCLLCQSPGQEAPLPIVLLGNDNASNDKQVFTPSRKPKTLETMAKGEEKLQAKPPKSDDGQEEQNGFVKIKELGEDYEEAQTF